MPWEKVLPEDVVITTTHKQLARILQNHKGRDNPITAGELAMQLGIYSSSDTSQPKLRRIIRELILYMKIPIGAYSKGYYIMTSIVELRHYQNSIRSRNRENLRRLHRIEEAYRSSKRSRPIKRR